MEKRNMETKRMPILMLVGIFEMVCSKDSKIKPPLQFEGYLEFI